MGRLAALFKKLFDNNLSFWGGIFDRSVALRIAWVASAVALFAGFMAAINAILAGLTYAIPTNIVIGASWVMPDNFDECFSIYVSAWAIRHAFEFKWNISKAVGKGTAF